MTPSSFIGDGDREGEEENLMRVEEGSRNNGEEEVRKSHQIGPELNQYLTHCRRSRSSSFSSTTTANNSSDSTFPSMWDN